MMHSPGAGIYDITVPLTSETVCFPGDCPPCLSRLSDVKRGDALTASHLAMGCHVGTHIDAPAHFLSTGMTVDQLPLNTFYGPAEVVDCRGLSRITEQDLRERSLSKSCHLLLHTDNSPLLRQSAFCDMYTVLSPDGAAYLASLCPLSIGFDYYSLDPLVAPHGYAAHCVLAASGISVFVCLDLSQIQEGPYLFAGLPLRLTGAEAAPVRALLIAS